MATYTKLSSGSWRVQVRRKGRYVSETFLRRDNARRWATETERQVDRGETPTKSRIARLKTFGELIDLHIDDMCDVGKSPRRSKAAALDMLQRHLGKCNLAALDRERLIRFGRDRAAQGAEERRTKRSNDDDRIFPFNHKSVGTAFRRGCGDLDIRDLHFHNLRHEGTSRLFEAGFTIEQVALVPGHKDWKMLRRYTHLKPEMLHTIHAAKVA
ncbi:tyrosine-type recombinase/integrase [Mesorhizobium sp. RIZ17]|uniref:tyrosine-type recombinase/integrase n=1 Tax=Mesorhizobium sp. RIZ17 TaxID=3132743 RepID=UPI003DA7DB89